MENYNINFQQQLASKRWCRSGMLDRRVIGCGGSSISASPVRRNQRGRYRLQLHQRLRYFGASVRRQSVRRFLRAAGELHRQSNYNSLQASHRINGWHGITSIVNYVWSKSLDNSSDGEDFEPNAAQPNDSTNPQFEYGPSNFNMPQPVHLDLQLRSSAHGREHAASEEWLGHRTAR